MAPQPCGIPRFDALYSTASAPPIRPGDARQRSARCRTFSAGTVPRGYALLTSPSYGTFGSATTAALRNFHQAHDLAQQEGVERDTLAKLVSGPLI